MLYILINNINGDIMIKKIMNKNIIYGDINSSIKDIASLMKKHNIGFIPIKDKNKFVGVVTDRDIAVNIPIIKSFDDSIKSYMTNNLISIDSNSNVDSALNTFKKYKIKRVLVKEKDKIIGVLSLSDILNYEDNNKLLDVYRSIFSIHDNRKNDMPEVDNFCL